MNAIEFEKYCFLRLYSIDFDTAEHTIKILRRYKKADVQYPLLRDIAVTYARPFSGNKGDLIVRHQLTPRHVPPGSIELHKELLRLRMQQFAHTDLERYRPKVAKFGTASRPSFPMAFRGYDFARLLARLSEIERLLQGVVQSLQREIALYEKHL